MSPQPGKNSAAPRPKGAPTLSALAATLLGATALTAPGLVRAQTTAADVATAITSANSSGGLVNVNDANSTAITLTGVTLPTLTSGTLVLGPINSETGSTPLVGGSIVDDATIQFRASGVSVFTPVSTSISGTGTVSINESGITFSGTNTYSGGTTISSGTAVYTTPSALPSSGSVLLATQFDEPPAVIATTFALDQTTLNLLSASSNGSAAAITGNVSNALDFTRLPLVSLGAVDPSTLEASSAVYTFSGTIDPALNTRTHSGLPSYEVGGGNAILDIASNLPDSAGAVTDLEMWEGGTVILSGDNTFTGGVQVHTGELELASQQAYCNGVFANCLQINVPGAEAAVGVDWALDQTTLNAFAPTSAGGVDLGADSANPLDFTNLPNARLGSLGDFTYSGVLTPGANGYRLGDSFVGPGVLTVSSALGGAFPLTVIGDVVLTGDNTYTGSTTVVLDEISVIGVGVGVLQLGNGVTNGTIADSSGVSLWTTLDTSGGVLKFNEASPIIFGAPISGTTPGAGSFLLNGFATSVYQDGPGEVTLTADETYTGFTQITNSTLAIGAGGSIASSSYVTLFSSGTTPAVLDISQGGNQTIQSLESETSAGSPSAQVVLGGNTLTDLVGSSAIGQILAPTSNFDGVISGTGGLVKSGPGMLTLSGTNTYSGGTTIGTGTLTLGVPPSAGVTGSVGTLGSGPIADNAALVFAEPSAVTLSNVITGAGTLTQNGPGAVTLDGVSTNTGATQIAGGELIVGDDSTPTAQLGGNVTVSANGTLAGIGTILGNVTNDGTLDNNDPFTAAGLTIHGTYTQGASANLIVGVTPSTVTLLTVGGTASLGGTVTFAYAPGTYTSKTYTFLESAGLGASEFSTVAASGTDPLPSGASQAVTYTTDDANLVFTASPPPPPPPPPVSPPPPPPPPPVSPPPPPPPPPVSPPPPPPPPPVSPPPPPPPPPVSPPPPPPPPPVSPPPPPPPPPPVSPPPPPPPPPPVSPPPPPPPPPPVSPPPPPPPPPVSPPPPPPPPPAPPPPPPPPPPVSPPPPPPPPPPPVSPPPAPPPPPPPVVVAPRDGAIFADQLFAFAEENQASLVSLLDRSGPDGGADSFALADGSTARGWIEAVGGFLDPTAAGSPHFRATSGGVEGGVDIGFGPSGRVGAALGYEQGSLRDAAGGEASQDLIRLSAYGQVTAGRLVFSAAVDYAHASESFARAAGFGASVSSRDIDEEAGAAQVSLPLDLAGTSITPSVGVVVAGLSGGAFQETNAQSSAFAVSGASTNATVVSPFATVRVSHAFTQASGLVVTPAAELGYRYDDAAGGIAQTLFAADGTPFVGNAPGLERSSAVVGASLTARQGRFAGFVRYQADIAGDWNLQSVQAGFKVAF